MSYVTRGGKGNTEPKGGEYLGYFDDDDDEKYYEDFPSAEFDALEKEEAEKPAKKKEETQQFWKDSLTAYSLTAGLGVAWYYYRQYQRYGDPRVLAMAQQADEIVRQNNQRNREQLELLWGMQQNPIVVD